MRETKPNDESSSIAASASSPRATSVVTGTERPARARQPSRLFAAWVRASNETTLSGATRRAWFHQASRPRRSFEGRSDCASSATAESQRSLSDGDSSLATSNDAASQPGISPVPTNMRKSERLERASSCATVRSHEPSFGIVARIATRRAAAASAITSAHCTGSQGTETRPSCDAISRNSGAPVRACASIGDHPLVRRRRAVCARIGACASCGARTITTPGCAATIRSSSSTNARALTGISAGTMESGLRGNAKAEET